MRIKRRTSKKRLRAADRQFEASRERELDEALAGTFPASDPVGVDSAEEHRSRLARKDRTKAAGAPPAKSSGK